MNSNKENLKELKKNFDIESRKENNLLFVDALKDSLELKEKNIDKLPL